MLMGTATCQAVTPYLGLMPQPDIDLQTAKRFDRASFEP